MLSICIPVYNCKVNLLTNALLDMANRQSVPIEIILIDDASLFVYHKQNVLLAGKYVKYIRLDENIGRAKIRNLFLKYAKYEYLLFLDCDSKLTKHDFIAAYLSSINKNSGVICGGRIYDAKKKERNYRLRQKYGIDRECPPVNKRKQNPYSSFMSNNFLIKREIFQKIPFDERLKKYGHEDTLFAYRLRQNNILVQHIDNPALHDFDEDNREFIKKTEQAIENLLYISNNLAGDKFFKEVKLLRTYEQLKKYSFDKVLLFSFVYFLPLLRKILINSGGELFLFDIYKLLYIIKLSKNLQSSNN
ncbi:MAG: glycosyltransferase [Bacteroidales bacterium]|nr:glycosyltransferase [Bacteroidales bacterium]